MFNSTYRFFNYEPQNDDMAKELEKRIQLFPKLDEKEIERRSKIILNRDDNIVDNRESILEAMVKILQATEPNASYIKFDFRYYQKAHFSSMIFSNISDYWLSYFLNFSKFSQGWFILFNINQSGIKIIQGSKVNDLDNISDITIQKEYGYSTYNLKTLGLKNTEYILNVSHIKNQDLNEKVVWTNFKFNHQGNPYSIIAENVSGLNLDLRAASTYQEIMAKISSSYLFTISIYSLKDSNLNGGKETSGYYKYVDNRGMTGYLDKFQDNIVANYSEPNGHYLEVLGNTQETLNLETASIPN